MAKTEFEREINDTLYNIAKAINLDQGNATKAMKKTRVYRYSCPKY